METTRTTKSSRRRPQGSRIRFGPCIAGFGLSLFAATLAGGDGGPENLPRPQVRSTGSGDPLNIAYTIEGKEVRLNNGYQEEQAAPGSATKIKTWVFGQPVYGDLGGEGDRDAALFLVQSPGGSGTFYYVAAALKAGDKYRGTNAVLLGDRIAPQTIEIRKGIIIVQYADRRPDEPMTALPSVKKTKYLALKNGRLEEIESPGRAGGPK